MYEQGYISAEQLEEGTKQALPSPDAIEPPTIDSKAPYFTAYLRQQLVERYGASKAFFAGLKVKSTLDLGLQEAAEEAVNSYLGYSPATASVVVIDNRNAGIKAMVGGPDFDTAPFNLATQGHRQPGSSIKPFIAADRPRARGSRRKRSTNRRRRNSASARTGRKSSPSPTTATSTPAPARSSAPRPTPTTPSTPSWRLKA